MTPLIDSLRYSCVSYSRVTYKGIFSRLISAIENDDYFKSMKLREHAIDTELYFWIIKTPDRITINQRCDQASILKSSCCPFSVQFRFGTIRFSYCFECLYSISLVTIYRHPIYVLSQFSSILLLYCHERHNSIYVASIWYNPIYVQFWSCTIQFVYRLK